MFLFCGWISLKFKEEIGFFLIFLYVLKIEVWRVFFRFVFRRRFLRDYFYFDMFVRIVCAVSKLVEFGI